MTAFDGRFSELRREVDATMQAQIAAERDELLDRIEDHWSGELADALPDLCRTMLARAATDAGAKLAAGAGPLAGAVAERHELGAVTTTLEAPATDFEVDMPGRPRAARQLDQERMLGWLTRGGPMLMIGAFSGNPVLSASASSVVAASEHIQGSSARSPARPRVRPARRRSRPARASHGRSTSAPASVRTAFADELHTRHNARVERLRATVRALESGADVDGARRRVAEVDRLQGAVAGTGRSRLLSDPTGARLAVDVGCTTVVAAARARRVRTRSLLDSRTRTVPGYVRRLADVGDATARRAPGSRPIACLTSIRIAAFGARWRTSSPALDARARRAARCPSSRSSRSCSRARCGPRRASSASQPAHAVLAIPSGWPPDGRRARAMRAAAAIAGLPDVTLIAAAVAAAELVRDAEPVTVLVCDVGGRSCQLSLVEVADGPARLLATTELVVGADLFDELLYLDVLRELGEHDADAAARLDDVHLQSGSRRF